MGNFSCFACIFSSNTKIESSRILARAKTDYVVHYSPMQRPKDSDSAAQSKVKSSKFSTAQSEKYFKDTPQR